jgi:two-component system, sensor histidine kinase
LSHSPPPANADDHGLRERIGAEQVAILYRNARASRLTIGPVAWLLVWILWDGVNHAGLLAWAGGLTVLSLARVIQGWLYRRSPQPQDPAWGRRFIVLLTVEALLWSLLGSALLPAPHRDLEALVLATLIGVASVGAFVLQPRYLASLLFVTITILPAAVTQLLHLDEISLYAAIALSVYLGLMLFEAHHAERHILELLRLRFTTDRHAAERSEALRLAERQSAVKSQFLATMSHEMRTPLHGILGLTRLLRERDTGVPVPLREGPAEQPLVLMEQAGEHLLTLINDVLDFAKLEAGHVQLKPRNFDLAALVDEVAALGRAAAREGGLGLVCAGELAQPCWVHGDGSRLRQILQNLIGNAVKFTQAGTVTVRARHDAASGQARIEVHDTGIGIAPGDVERIFDAFHQVDSSFGRRFSGTGLGLTISRELARAMGGDLVCSSEAGQGSCFTVTLQLPRATAPRPVPLHTAATAPRLRGRVLLAEDNPVNALVAEAALRRLGLAVEVVSDGASALTAFRAAAHDLVLMDCQMPVMDGFEATRLMRDLERIEGRRRTAVVALTANALEGDRERSLASGMDDHLAKPFRDDELIAVLQRHLPPAA